MPRQSPTPQLEIAQLALAAPAEAVVSGARDAQFVVRADHKPFIYERARSSSWWRVRTDTAVPAGGEPVLLLHGPYLTQVEAWVPGARQPTRHGIYGADVDPRYSTRALVIDLPQGLAAGRAVYLRVTAPAAVPMVVQVRTRDQVHRDDLVYVAWRTTVLASLAVLLLLSFAFWAGVGERTYLYLGATLACGALYLAGNGGEARDIPLLEPIFASTPQAVRVVGCLGTMASNHFMRLYLDLSRQAPRVDAVLRWLTILMGALALANALVDTSTLARVGNLVLVASSLAIFAAAAVTSRQGNRASQFLMVSWLPLIVTSILRVLQLSGVIVGAAWFTHALAGSFALSGLILTIGLSDKLLQLRRDRDLASRQANMDGLTGLLNRPAIDRELREQVAAAHASGRPMSVAFVDIDRFKAINDTHGHHVGDGCLRSISQRVRQQLRKHDLLGRYGGDELLVVMPNTDLADGLGLAERLRQAVNGSAIACEDVSIQSSLSIGLATLLPGENAERLLERADSALYTSKASGRDQVSGAGDAALPQAAT